MTYWSQAKVWALAKAWEFSKPHRLPFPSTNKMKDGYLSLCSRASDNPAFISTFAFLMVLLWGCRTRRWLTRYAQPIGHTYHTDAIALGYNVEGFLSSFNRARRARWALPMQAHLHGLVTDLRPHLFRQGTLLAERGLVTDLRPHPLLPSLEADDKEEREDGE